MPFWNRRASAEEDETYEEPVQARSPEPSATGKEARRLAKLRKKAHKAAKKATQESEKARKAARKVREASTASNQETREVANTPEPDVPGGMAGKDRAKVLAKKDKRRLDRLRRKAQKPS